jgi:hypothetical protein
MSNSNLNNISLATEIGTFIRDHVRQQNIDLNENQVLSLAMAIAFFVIGKLANNNDNSNSNNNSNSNSNSNSSNSNSNGNSSTLMLSPNPSRSSNSNTLTLSPFSNNNSIQLSPKTVAKVSPSRKVEPVDDATLRVPFFLSLLCFCFVFVFVCVCVFGCY